MSTAIARTLSVLPVLCVIDVRRKRVTFWHAIGRTSKGRSITLGSATRDGLRDVFGCCLANGIATRILGARKIKEAPVHAKKAPAPVDCGREATPEEIGAALAASGHPEDCGGCQPSSVEECSECGAAFTAELESARERLAALELPVFGPDTALRHA